MRVACVLCALGLSSSPLGLCHEPGSPGRKLLPTARPNKGLVHQRRPSSHKYRAGLQELSHIQIHASCGVSFTWGIPEDVLDEGRASFVAGTPDYVSSGLPRLVSP